MKNLIIIPILGAVIAGAGMFLSDAASAPFYRVVLIVAALATAISAFITTSRFEPGDTLFTAWLLVGSGYALAAIRYSVRLIGIIVHADLLNRPILDGMLILQNAVIAIALWLFVRTWSVTRIGAPGSRAARVGWTIAGIAIAVVAGGYPLMQGLATAKADTVLLVSTLGDVIGIALIVPLAMSALALRGGLLMHTWLYLAVCEICWLLYDLWLAGRQSLGVEPRIGTGIEQMIRVAAISFALIATVAQRRALR